MSTLVMFAAGLGQRFGGHKQGAALGPNGERLLDYTLYDAYTYGFRKVVFVIQAQDKLWVEQTILPIWSSLYQIETVIQSISDPTVEMVDRSLATHRTKPWGTGHALLKALRVLEEPFFVANADDFYGAQAWAQAGKAMRRIVSGDIDGIIIAYPLGSTLSNYGGVSRGVCCIDRKGWLTSIEEYADIRQEQDGIEGIHITRHTRESLSHTDLVSMNLVGLCHGQSHYAEEVFEEFLRGYMPETEHECLITDVFHRLLSNQVRICVEQTTSQWMGLTRRHDTLAVKEALYHAHTSNKYPNDLI